MCESSLPALGSSPSWNLQTLGQRVPCLPSFITDSAGQGSCAWGQINSLFPPPSFKQQNLEQRQADVEYELRCLLNKPGACSRMCSLGTCPRDWFFPATLASGQIEP